MSWTLVRLRRPLYILNLCKKSGKQSYRTSSLTFNTALYHMNNGVRVYF